MLITLKGVEIDAEPWDGTNDDFITAHLGRDDWRKVGDVETQPGWWLFLYGDGSIGQMTDEAMQWRRVKKTQ